MEDYDKPTSPVFPEPIGGLTREADLHLACDEIQRRHLLMIARNGTTLTTQIVRFWVDDKSSNNGRLVIMAYINRLIIAGTIFDHAKRHLIT